MHSYERGALVAIEVFDGAELSLERALNKVPNGYRQAYDWFMSHRDIVGPRPYGRNAPEGMPVKLTAQRGIHKPSGMRYALSITSSNSKTYSGDHLHELEDGTWLLQYCAHRRNSGKSEGSQEYNNSLKLCLRDGIPVGVFIKQTTGFRCLGLAFVERFNTTSNMFWLHGPVDPSTSLSPLTTTELNEYRNLLVTHTTANISIDPAFVRAAIDLPTEQDERERAVTQLVRRKNQDRFRKMLIEAYRSQCAISRFDALPALQAAHISSYLGPKSQLVTNGLLLRADLHLLFDDNLLSIDPGDMRVHISKRIQSTRYAEYAGKEIALPTDKEQRPSEQRLASQYADFLQSESLF